MLARALSAMVSGDVVQRLLYGRWVAELYVEAVHDVYGLESEGLYGDIYGLPDWAWRHSVAQLARASPFARHFAADDGVLVWRHLAGASVVLSEVAECAAFWLGGRLSACALGLRVLIRRLASPMCADLCVRAVLASGSPGVGGGGCCERCAPALVSPRSQDALRRTGNRAAHAAAFARSPPAEQEGQRAVLHACQVRLAFIAWATPRARL